ncbi:MAG: hypothetical protein ACLQT7_03235 [Candidatus Dormibacteria bacterium]
MTGTAKGVLVLVGGVLGLAAGGCAPLGQASTAVLSPEAICAQNFPAVVNGNYFFVGTTIAADQTVPALTSAGYTGFCQATDDATLGLSGYVCLDDAGGSVGLVTTWAEASTLCQAAESQGDYTTIVTATRDP